MTVPPNTLAALSIWGTVWASSKVNKRAPFIIGAAIFAIIGMLIKHALKIQPLISYAPVGRVYNFVNHEDRCTIFINI